MFNPITKEKETMGKLKLTGDQEKLITSFTKEEREAFEALKDDKKVEMLELIQATAAPVVVDLEFEDVGADEEEDITILSSGGLGCKAGTVFVAEFLGTMPMFSKAAKENWDEIEVEGVPIWVNHYYVFRNPKTGKKFGLYKAPFLNRVLPKVPTAATNPTIANPVIKITYVDKVKGKDKLKELYDFELQSGNEAHVHLVQLPKGLRYDRYRSGFCNYLRPAVPAIKGKEKLSLKEQMEKDWAQIENLNSGGQAQLGHVREQAAIETNAH
jgi:hypothetical protein